MNNKLQIGRGRKIEIFHLRTTTTSSSFTARLKNANLLKFPINFPTFNEQQYEFK